MKRRPIHLLVQRIKHGASGVEPTVEHRNVATCRERETKAVAQPLPVRGMQVHVSRCRAQTKPAPDRSNR